MQVYVIINGYKMLETLVPLTTSTIKCLEDQLQVHCQTDNEKKTLWLILLLHWILGTWMIHIWGDTSFEMLACDKLHQVHWHSSTKHILHMLTIN